MSNHGIRILYDIANSIEGVACERVFSVDTDFEKRLREFGIPLFTLESHTPLAELDMLAFTCRMELLYTNMSRVLDLGGVPFMARERNGSQPLVIAGGESTCNPAPMGDFVDAFFLGDGEEGITEIAACLLSAKRKSLTVYQKLALLEEIVRAYTSRRCIASSARTADSPRSRGIGCVKGRTAHRRRIFRCAPLFRISALHRTGRLSRSPGAVRTCAASAMPATTISPAGEYSPRLLSDGIMTVIDNSGYDELTLASLSIGDYRHLAELLNEILPRLNERGVSISLPSLRVDTGTLPIIERISSLRRASLTFAVESASEEMRALANKRISTDDLLAIVAHVFERGWQTLKLFFIHDRAPRMRERGRGRGDDRPFKKDRVSLQGQKGDQCHRLALCAQAADTFPSGRARWTRPISWMSCGVSSGEYRDRSPSRTTMLSRQCSRGCLPAAMSVSRT